MVSQKDASPLIFFQLSLLRSASLSYSKAARFPRKPPSTSCSVINRLSFQPSSLLIDPGGKESLIDASSPPGGPSVEKLGRLARYYPLRRSRRLVFLRLARNIIVLPDPDNDALCKAVDWIRAMSNAPLIRPSIRYKTTARVVPAFQQRIAN